MVLFMPSPFKHPSTGVYWLRQRTPANVKVAAKGQIVHLTIAGLPVRRTVGDELVVSLSTKEPAVAKQRAIEALAQFDAVWATFAIPPAKLTFKEVVALAGAAFRAFQATEDDPASPEVWRNIIEVNLAALKGELLLAPAASKRASERLHSTTRAGTGPCHPAVSYADRR